MLIPITHLSVSAENPRKTRADDAAHVALVASLKAHGQIVPIIVKPNGSPEHFEIIEGGRRFAAAQEAGLSEMKAELYTGDLGTAEIGTAANMMRAAMHPLDEANVIARLIADGQSAADVALRFGQTERWAEQRLKLDRLSDRVKKAFRAGTLGLAAAQAFTIADKKAQDEYLKAARNDWQLEADTIRDHFTRADIPATAAVFDLAKYPASKIRRDLFGEEVWLTDREAFDRLQREQLPLEVESLQAEGWGTVEIIEGRADLYRTMVKVHEPKKKERAKLSAFVIYDPASGQVRIERGWAERKAAKTTTKGEHPSDDQADAEAVPDATCFDLSQSQREMIGALQTVGIAQAIANGDTWLALYTLLSPLLDDMRSPAWAGLRDSVPHLHNANAAFDDKLSLPAENGGKFPGRAAFEKMSWDEVVPLIRAAAAKALMLMMQPSPEATKVLKATGTEWFRYDAGFLRRYRLDALQDLAQRLKVPFDGVKKKDLIAAILARTETPFIPVHWSDLDT